MILHRGGFKSNSKRPGGRSKNGTVRVAPKSLPQGGSQYGIGARKAASSIQKQYGPNWAHVYYGLANKRAGRGAKGRGRMHGVATTAFAKGSHWGGKAKKTGVGRRRVHG